MRALSKEERAEWSNIWRILRSLDWRDLAELLDQSDSPDPDYAQFRDHPHRYLLQADDRRADAIWRAVEKRLK